MSIGAFHFHTYNLHVLVHVANLHLYLTNKSLISGGPKLILDLEPPDSVYLLKAGDVAPVIKCKPDCSPDCDILWRKVGGNSSLTYTHEYMLDLRPFAVEKAGEYICVAKRHGTNEVGVRAVTFKMEDKTGL